MAYTFEATIKASTDFKYSFGAAIPLDSTRTINYLFTGNNNVVNDKVFGWRSDFTQIIANSFQDWNRIRKDPESTGQYLINAVAASIEEVNRYWNAERKEMFLETADEHQP